MAVIRSNYLATDSDISSGPTLASLLLGFLRRKSRFFLFFQCHYAGASQMPLLGTFHIAVHTRKTAFSIFPVLRKKAMSTSRNCIVTPQKMDNVISEEDINRYPIPGGPPNEQDEAPFLNRILSQGAMAAIKEKWHILSFSRRM